MRTLILKQFFVNFDIDTTIENSNFDIRKICAEPLKFMTYLDKFRKQIKLYMHVYVCELVCIENRIHLHVETQD